MKHLHTFESYVNEGAVKQFEYDYKQLVKSIKQGAGWIDPENVEEAWDDVADFGPIDPVKDEVLNRLIKDGLLYSADKSNPIEKGNKITNISQIK
jgi:hypothetical protein